VAGSGPQLNSDALTESTTLQRPLGKWNRNGSSNQSALRIFRAKKPIPFHSRSLKTHSEMLGLVRNGHGCCTEKVAVANREVRSICSGILEGFRQCLTSRDRWCCKELFMQLSQERKRYSQIDGVEQSKCFLLNWHISMLPRSRTQ